MKVKEQLKKAFETSCLDGKVESNSDYKMELVSNNYRLGEKVLVAIENELRQCDEFLISVAFITSSGIIALKQTFKELEKKGIKGKILTTDYLMFSEPKALRELSALKNIELRMYQGNSSEIGFHTKGYIFHSDDIYKVIIGSSNLTLKALTKNIEWNTKLVTTEEGELSCKIVDEFYKLWNNEYTSVFEDFIDEYESRYNEYKKTRENISLNIDNVSPSNIKPNKMQKSFIDNVIEMKNNGANKALLISSTGTGKSFASAFMAKEMCPEKILFLVHREQIAKQAIQTFKKIFGNTRSYGLVSGSYKEYNKDFIFATMQTMSKKDVFSNFSEQHFDLIIIDECHHAGSKSYKRIMDYFKPQFLLGMTASPDTNQYDIYTLFENNIAYEVRLQQALEYNLLCPFQYFGITDLKIDDEVIEDMTQFNKLISDERVDFIIEQANYYGYSGERLRGLVFCSTIDEAKELSNKFNERGFKTAFLSGADDQKKREKTIELLTSNSECDYLDYIFTVDIFNEGVDIPEINQVIMLRPTQSPVVFIQQLGRGLRKYKDKEYVVVLDFIGNYNNNFMIPIALSGERSGNKDQIRKSLAEGTRTIPGESTIHFDEIAKKRIYDSIDKAKINGRVEFRQAYKDVKIKLGKIPNLLEFDKYASVDVSKIFNIKNWESYYAFICDNEGESYQVKLSEKQKNILAFLSKKVALSKRIHELALLEYLINTKKPLLNYKKLMSETYNIEIDDRVELSVKRNLTNQFTMNKDREKYSDCILIDVTNQGYILSNDFQNQLKNESFNELVKEIIQYGIRWWKNNYSATYKDTNLVLYQKYTYEDVCRILNWKSNENAQNIGGYKYNEFTKTLPVFINYQKDSNAITYEDRFISNNHLIALSKKPRKINSKDANRIYKIDSENKENRIFLFIRKNKNDKENAKEFYFLGEIFANGNPNPVQIDGANAFEIDYQLDVPVRSDIYDYIINE